VGTALLRGLFGLQISTGATESEAYSGSTYSFLQYQAKCSTSAPYRYLSWGGSYVEDFLDHVTSFALLACFSTVEPQMVIIGFATKLIGYRIVAYRMTNVTCRPYPHGAEGIGLWQTILDTVAALAVTCIVALQTFYRPPTSTWSFQSQVIFFIVAEKVMFSIRALVRVAFPSIPADVVRIQDHNEMLSALKFDNDPVLPVGKSDFDSLDIGLHSPM